jgi:hypothetical protein
MSFDFDDLLKFVTGGGREACLVELGRAAHKDGTTTGYAWSTGRIGATVGSGWVRIRRRRGKIGMGKGDNDLKLEPPELCALHVACRDWAARRDAWAAFYFSASGYPGGFGGAFWYQPPGKNAKRKKLGEHVGGRAQGEQLSGEDDIVPLAREVKVSESVRIDAEIWRRGEKHGPAKGSLVGVRYRIGNERAVFMAQRKGGEVRCQRCTVHLESGEEDFIAALLEAGQFPPPATTAHRAVRWLREKTRGKSKRPDGSS